MRLLSVILALALAPGALASEHAKNEFRFVIAGIDDSDLAALFFTLNDHYSDELGDELADLGWSGSIALLNIARDTETGNVQRVTFSRGNFFIVFFPLERIAQSSVYLKPGFEYEVKLKVIDGAAFIIEAGTISTGAEPFEVN